MPQIVTILVASWAAGLTAPLGGILARHEGSAETEGKRELLHGIVALGGGLLVAAVAFALLPEGMEHLHPATLALTFVAGGVAFLGLDMALAKRGGSTANFLAMMMDFLPEALSLGAVFGRDPALGMLLAAFIGAQNLPEGFNAFRELRASGAKPRSALLALLAASFVGPLAASAGWAFLQEEPALTAGIMTFASGGILYLVFQDIAPQASMRRHWAPPLGAVLGFLVGMMGKVLVG